MELLLNLAIICLATIGGLYALGLIIVALIGPPTIDDTECQCKGCNK
jgi:hypothetical protein